MDSIHSKPALCGLKSECDGTETVFFSISEVSGGTLSLDLVFSFYLLTAL